MAQPQKQDARKQAQDSLKTLQYTMIGRLAKAMAKEYSIQGSFKLGYRNKEDISNLPPYTLVVGSQNVLSYSSDRIGIRQGYVLDGPASTQNSYGVDSSYDFNTRTNGIQNVRKWGTNLECRYVNPTTSAVSWVNIYSTLATANVVNFTDFWDFTTEVRNFCLFVNGDANIYEWTGGVGSFASATVNTIVVSGSKTITQLNFYTNNANSAKFKVTIDGVTYTYTGVSGNTLTGVSPDPTGAGIAVGDAVIQVPAVGASSVTASSLTTYDLIATYRNQVYYGSLTNNTVYISKVNAYADCTVSTPRVVAEGANATLDAPPTAFKRLSDGMYISAGRDFWYRSKFTLSSDLAKESFEFNALKTSVNQGAQTQGLVGQLKNSLVYVSYEQIFNSFGPVKNILGDPQVVNMSDSIKYDMDAYDFSSPAGQVFYDSYFVYVSIPKNNVVRMYNVAKKYWEAPQVLPVGRFYHVSGSNLYGHSASTNESYQLFVPNTYSDNGNPINAIAAFPYLAQEGAEAVQKKFFNKFFTEGYLSGNTTLNLQFNYDFGGYSGTYTKALSGANKRKTFNSVTDGSLGENTLGSQPLGSILNIPSWALVPKFRSVDTFTPVSCYEYQVIYSSNDVDQNWTLLRFGPAIKAANDMPVDITD